MILTIPPVQPIKKGTYDLHVVSINHGSAWAVKNEQNEFYSMVAPTQTEAIAFGMHQARESAAQLVIHGRDGRFRDVRNYA